MIPELTKPGRDYIQASINGARNFSVYIQPIGRHTYYVVFRKESLAEQYIVPNGGRLAFRIKFNCNKKKIDEAGK